MPARLGRYHDVPDSAFWGWNDIWLKAEFRAWNIERELDGIRCPMLAVQGVDDEYGTLEQIRGIRRHLPRTQLVELADCGHSPHRDQPQRLIDCVTKFVASARNETMRQHSEAVKDSIVSQGSIGL